MGTLGTWRSAYRKTLKLQRVQSSIVKQAAKAAAADQPQDNGAEPRESTAEKGTSSSAGKVEVMLMGERLWPQ
jgi:hypothetical protein